MLSQIRLDTTIFNKSAPLRQSNCILSAGHLLVEYLGACINIHLWVTLAGGVFLICHHPKTISALVHVFSSSLWLILLKINCVVMHFDTRQA